MRSLVVSQRAQLAAHDDLDSKRDLFSRLLRANEGEEKKLALDDDELVKFLRAFRYYIRTDARLHFFFKDWECVWVSSGWTW